VAQKPSFRDTELLGDLSLGIGSEAVRQAPELELRQLWATRGIFTCPTSFNKLTVAWYCNDSDDPNIAPDESLRFYALRDIKANEELVSRYADYSE
jgi:hypothetical protein